MLDWIIHTGSEYPVPVMFAGAIVFVLMYYGILYLESLIEEGNGNENLQSSDTKTN